MKKYIVFFLASIIPSLSLAWECPRNTHKNKNIDEFEYLWINKENVFLGSLKKGEVLSDNKGYLYIIDVQDNLKGDTEKSVSLKADGVSPLAFGESYIFFTDNDNELDFCDFYREFSMEWLEREDIPQHREFVERIVAITGYRVQP